MTTALSDIHIRPARLEDAGDLASLCFPEEDAGRVRDYLAFCLRHPHITRLVVEANGRVVGNIELVRWKDKGEIGGLCVAAAFRRRGIARRLLEAAVELARRQGIRRLELYAPADQPWLLAFYRRMGFDGAEKAWLPLTTGGAEVVRLHMGMSPPCGSGEPDGIWVG